jgi:hypothetical protein
LRAERQRERRGFFRAHFYAQGAAFGAFRNAGYEEIVTGEDQTAFGAAEFDQGTRVGARAEAAAADGQLATREGRVRFHSINFWNAV